jgi:putative ABC transport system permease protein
LPRADEISLNAPVLTAALALTLLTGLAFGLAPGLTATRIDANDALKDNARGSGGPAARRLRSGLVVAEIALALVLLVGAALFARNFIGLLTRDSGFEAKRVLSMTLLPSAARYDSPAKLREFYTRAEAEVAAVPGVQSAGFTQTSPFRWGIPMTLLPVPINGPVLDENVPQTFYDSVSADYFKSIGSALRAGRVFDATDVADGKPVVILSESTARRLFGQENPLGRYVTNGATSKTRLEVIGVVADVRRIGLAAEIPLQAYRSIQQRPTAFATLMVRTTLPPATLAKSVQAALWRVDADLPISNIAPMDEVMGNTVTKPKLYLTLFGLFAGIALCLAGIGLYGLIAYSVAQRTREFGIRSALGANASDILRLVLRESTHLVALGLSLGLLGAFATARVLQQMLFQTSAYDPLSFISVPLILAGVALTACLIPARRAARVDPAIALRAE